MLGGQWSLQTAGGSWSSSAHFVSPVCHRDGDIVTKYQNYLDRMSILDVTHIRSPLDGDMFQVLSWLKCHAKRDRTKQFRLAESGYHQGT